MQKGSLFDKEKDAEALLKAQELCHRYSPYDLACKVGAFYAFNMNPGPYLQSHLVVRFMLSHGDVNSSKKAGPETIMRIVGLLTKSIDQILPGAQEFSERVDMLRGLGTGRPVDLVSEFQSMRMASSLITNPGAPGEMIEFALDKYEPHHQLVQDILGFDVKEAFRTLVLLLLRMNKRTVNDATRILLKKRRLMNISKMNVVKMFIPPKEFLDAWESATIFAMDDLRNEMTEVDPDFKVVRFLSSDIRGFCSDVSFISRFCVLHLPNNMYQVPLPQSTIESLCSAIHLGLLERMNDSSKGSYGRTLGRVFEDIVSRLLQNYIPDEKITNRKKVRDSAGKIVGDIDVYVELPDSTLIMAQCKGRMLRSKGRWGDYRTFESDFLRTVDESIRQFQTIFAARPDLAKRTTVAAVILDPYIPGAVNYLRMRPPNTSSLPVMPHVMVASYYDLSYLVKMVNPGELEGYLAWKKVALESGLVPTDELDIIRAFINREHLPLERMAEKHITVHWTGRDRKYEADRWIEALRRLGLPEDILVPTLRPLDEVWMDD